MLAFCVRIVLLLWHLVLRCCSCKQALQSCNNAASAAAPDTALVHRMSQKARAASYADYAPLASALSFAQSARILSGRRDCVELYAGYINEQHYVAIMAGEAEELAYQH